MGIFDAIKNVVGNLDPKMLDPLVGKIGAIDFAPILKNLEGKAATDSKVALVLNFLKKLSKEKPQNASQLMNIANGFDSNELSSALDRVDKMDIPGLDMLVSLLKNFVKK